MVKYFKYLIYQPFFRFKSNCITPLSLRYQIQTFEKYSILVKAQKGENFNHRHTLSISRIELKLHFVQNVEPVDKSR